MFFFTILVTGKRFVPVCVSLSVMIFSDDSTLLFFAVVRNIRNVSYDCRLSVCLYEFLYKSEKLVLPFGSSSCAIGIFGSSAVSVAIATVPMLDSRCISANDAPVNNINLVTYAL